MADHTCGNIWKPAKRAELARLIETLNDVLTILRLDPQCLWSTCFEEFIRAARQLHDDGFTWDELKDYSRLVCNSMDALPAYRLPADLPAEGLYGTDNFGTFWRAAYQQADDLRTPRGELRDFVEKRNLEAVEVEGQTRTRIMYIERNAVGLTGDARIGRVQLSKTGKTIYYGGKQFEFLNGRGFKANYFDVESGEEYWISGCKRNGSDRLYGERIPVLIDDDVREEYWTKIRRQPQSRNKKTANM